MTKKDKFEYFWKTLFLVVFGLIIGVAAIYTLLAYPFSLWTVLYLICGLGGATFCGFMVKALVKEYIAKKKEE